MNVPNQMILPPIKLNFCIPVFYDEHKYQEKLVNPTVKDRVYKFAFKLGEFCDQYASLSRKENHIARQNVRQINTKGYLWKTVLKVISYSIFIFPLLALIAKKLYKDYCEEQYFQHVMPLEALELMNQGAIKQGIDAPQKHPILPQNLPEKKQPILLPKPPEKEQPILPPKPPEKKQPVVLPPVPPKQAKTPIIEPIDKPVVKVDPVKEKPAVVNQRIASYQIGKTAISLAEGDITKDQSEVLVNAANAELWAGSGVCGAFHTAAGQGIFDECIQMKNKLNVAAIPVGHAVFTSTGNIKQSKAILHAVGPKGGDEDRRTLMTNVIMNSLKMAAGIDILEDCISDKLPKDAKYRSIAFPPISTGIFGYPIKEAAEIAAQTVKDFVAQYPDAFDEINFVFLPLKQDRSQTIALYKETFDAQMVNPPPKVLKPDPVQIVNPPAQGLKPEVKHIYAKDSINQYLLGKGGESSCSHFGFSFIASDKPATPENIVQLLRDNLQPGPFSVTDVESLGLLAGKLERYTKVPFAINDNGEQKTINDNDGKLHHVDFNECIQIVKSDKSFVTFLKFLKKNLKDDKIHGCVLSDGFNSVAVRKVKDGIEFFDSHGPDKDIPGVDGKPAYVVYFPDTLDENTFVQKALPYFKARLDNGLELLDIPQGITAYPVVRVTK